MSKRRIAAIMGGLLAVSAMASCSAKQETNREVLYQVSLLQGLTFGDYNGSVTAAELKKNGDTGLGTFDGLDGEMIVLDGVVYKAASDGKVSVVSDDEKIPFSNVTFFDTDEKQKIENVADMAALKSLLDKKVEEKGANSFCVIKIEGTFSAMNVRSEYKQSEPYKPLAKVLETDQTFFDYTDIEGTVVGLYCPPYMNMLNAAGWHLHFISKDKTKGGHVLGLSVSSAELSLDYTDGFNMQLPDNDMFKSFNLTIDQSDDIKKVETGE